MPRMAFAALCVAVCFSGVSHATPTVKAVRTGEHSGMTRIVFDVTAATTATASLSDDAKSLTIRFPKKTEWSAAPARRVTKGNLLDRYEIERDDEGVAVKLSAKAPIAVSRKEIHRPDGEYGHRVSFDLVAGSHPAITITAAPVAAVISAPPAGPAAAQPSPSQTFSSRMLTSTGPLSGDDLRFIGEVLTEKEPERIFLTAAPSAKSHGQPLLFQAVEPPVPVMLAEALAGLDQGAGTVLRGAPITQPAPALTAPPPVVMPAANDQLTGTGNRITAQAQPAAVSLPSAAAPVALPPETAADAGVAALLDLERALRQAGGDYGTLVRDRLPAGRVQEAWQKAPPGRAVRTEAWQKSKEIKVRLREGVTTIIALPDWERVETTGLIVGAKDVVKAGVVATGTPNRVALVPVRTGVDSTVTVVGASGRLYPIYVVVEGDNSKNVPDQVVHVEAPAPFDWSPPGTVGGPAKDYLRELPFDLSKARSNFTMSGDAVIAPDYVMSDDNLTYLFFRDIDRMQLPAVNRVVDNIDMPVNTRRLGNVLLVESPVGEGLTLRAGQKSVCIRPS